MFEAAVKDLDRVISMNKDRSEEACVLRARVLERQGNLGEAALGYEEATRGGGDSSVGSEALFRLARLRFNQQDYYEALFDIRRAAHFSHSDKRVHLYRSLIEGVTDSISNLVGRHDDEGRGQRIAPAARRG